jgi:hypothetical protein
MSDYSNGSQCSCERYGITRSGDRVKLDCGGSRCGYSDEESCCSSSDDEYVERSTRRQGICPQIVNQNLTPGEFLLLACLPPSGLQMTALSIHCSVC